MTPSPTPIADISHDDAAQRVTRTEGLEGRSVAGEDDVKHTVFPEPEGQQPIETTEAAEPTKYDRSWARRVLTPWNCQWSDDSPTTLTMPLNLLYAFTTTFTIANLYYNQPILDRIAAEFGVSYETASQVPTLMQAGYAAGLVLILPLGDMVERRPFIISLVLFTATVWIGLCLTSSFTAFRAISFICGFSTVTPQLMIPLVGDFAPPQRKGAYLSIIVSGLLLGLLVARFLSGVVSNFAGWRNIYWLACGVQYLIALLLFCFMPDYPSTNPEALGYLQALGSILRMLVTEPVLVQACLIVFTMSGIFASYWTTVTFLLVSPPYEYSTLVVGLFSLVGIAAMVAVPLYGRIIDRFVPAFSIMVAQVIVLVVSIIGTLVGSFTLAGPVVQAIGVDIGSQTAQVANRTAIFGINPKARNRVNTAYMALAFAGQLTGTSVGNALYARGGWRWSSGFAIALAGFSLMISLCRGPRETRWVGWSGGWQIRK